MKKYFIGTIFWAFTFFLHAQETITIGKIMYQSQAFTSKDKKIFEARQGRVTCLAVEQSTELLQKPKT